MRELERAALRGAFTPRIKQASCMMLIVRARPKPAKRGWVIFGPVPLLK
jgi:hypothetical protein